MASYIARRKFLATLLGGAVASWPLAARAQQPAMPVIGFLNSASPGNYVPMVAAFRQGLKEAGYVEGQNVAVEYRWAEGQYDRVPVIALELVDRRVAVLVANTPGVLVVKAAITTTPIVFTTASDPVEIGLVPSMSRPSGNVTGATTMGVELASKLLELAHELVPTASVIAALINPANNSAEPQLRGLQAAARTLGVQLHVVQASSERDFGMVFANLAELRPGALVIANDGFFISRNEQLATLAARHALPAIFQAHAFAEIRAARCSPAPRSTPTSPQFAQRFLDFDAGGIIANNADWLDKLALHPVPGLGGSLRAAERRRLQEHPSQLRCG